MQFTKSIYRSAKSMFLSRLLSPLNADRVLNVNRLFSVLVRRIHAMAAPDAKPDYPVEVS